MLYEKSELEQYFKDEIYRRSQMEIEALDAEIADVRQKTLEGLEAEVRKEASILQEQEQKELRSEQAIRLGRLHEETNRKLMEKRQELSERIFAKAHARLQEFAASADYLPLLVKKATALGKHGFTDVRLYVRKADMAHAPQLQAAYGQACTVCADEAISCGGLRLECTARGIVVDETFDAVLEEQRDWFYTNSGLFVK